MAGPLRELEGVLDKIRNNTFAPDRTRSGYMLPAPKSQAAALQRPLDVKKAGELVQVDSRDDSSSDSSSESDDSAQASEDEQLAIVSRPANTHDNIQSHSVSHEHMGGYFFHIRYRTLHKDHSMDTDKLACGRPCTVMYRPIAFMPAFQYSKCHDCFRNADEHDSSG